MTTGFIVFLGMFSFVLSLTIGGVVFMVYTNCRCKIQCCCSICKDLEKRDLNPDYGTYYYDDGKKRADIVEVRWPFKVRFAPIVHTQDKTISGKRSKP